MKRMIPDKQDPFVWHTWWAWYPVAALSAEGTKYRVWLELVERRREADLGGSWWEYRV